MPDRTDTYDAHMRGYRQRLHALNRDLAEEYIHQHRQLAAMAIDDLAKAAPVALALTQLHEAIRRSPAKNFWPIIRETKGVLLVRSAGTEGMPMAWQRTNGGNLRYKLPGYLLFSPFPPNFRRMVRSNTVRFQELIWWIEDRADENDFRVATLVSALWHEMLRATHLIPRIKAFQELATPASTAALDRWSDEQQCGSNMALRMSQGMLVYTNGPDRCEIEIPDALSNPLSVPSLPAPLRQHWVRAGERSYL